MLSGVDFAVPEGRALALLGRNGGGKTTLLRLLSGGLRCTAGRLRVAGEDVSYDRKGLTRLRTTVQLVVQDPDDQLFAASVGQDVSFRADEPGSCRGRGAGPGAGGPGGARHRGAGGPADAPAVVRAAQAGRHRGCGRDAARVLILDEPTAGLDPHGQERLLAVLDGLRGSGTTVVMATHDVDLALRWADDAAVLVPDGLRTGPVAELLADADLLRAARLRRPWAVAVAGLLRSRGLLGAHEAGPVTAEELDAWAAAPTGTPADAAAPGEG